MGVGAFWITYFRRRPARLFGAHAPDGIAAASPLDLEMMHRALELADGAASRGEVPVGAVVYETRSGKVLGEGANAREASKDPTAHAEVLALANAARAVNDWRLNHCSLAVTLEPCPMCAGACVNARIGRLVYGAKDPKAGATESLYALLGDPRLNHQAQVISGVMGAQSSQRLKTFFRNLRK